MEKAHRELYQNRFSRYHDPTVVRKNIWIYDEEGSRSVEKWLDRVQGERKWVFYGSFLNWAMKQVSRHKDPNTKYITEQLKSNTAWVVETLRRTWHNTKAYCSVLKFYHENVWCHRKIKTGVITDPIHEGELEVLLRLSVVHC